MPGKAERGSIFRLPVFFRTRRGTAIRVLQYDGQGFWLARLEDWSS